MVSVESYKSDKYYPKVVRVFDEILRESIIVEPINVFILMDMLDRKGYEDWRFGRIPHLERAMKSGLPKCKRVLRIIGFHAHDLKMVQRPTVYMKWGKGRKIKLQFSKNAVPYLEERYATCFKWNRRLSYPDWKLSLETGIGGTPNTDPMQRLARSCEERCRVKSSGSGLRVDSS